MRLAGFRIRLCQRSSDFARQRWVIGEWRTNDPRLYWCGRWIRYSSCGDRRSCCSRIGDGHRRGRSFGCFRLQSYFSDNRKNDANDENNDRAPDEKRRGSTRPSTTRNCFRNTAGSTLQTKFLHLLRLDGRRGEGVICQSVQNKSNAYGDVSRVPVYSKPQAASS